jgi:hypothetical protein
MNILKFSSSLALATLMTASGVVATIAPSQAAPSPRQGIKLVCKERGFALDINGNVARCKLVTSVLIENTCPNTNFPKLTFMVGRDICTKNNTNVSSNGNLNGLTLNADYQFSVPSREAKRDAERRLENAFIAGTAIALPPGSLRPPVTVPRVSPAERDAVFAGQEVLVDDVPGIDDHTKVKFNVFMLPVVE